MGTRILRITPDLLIQFLDGSVFHRHHIHGIPSDARILGVSDRGSFFDAQEIAILLESSSWSPVPPGCCIPHITLTSSPKSHA